MKNFKKIILVLVLSFVFGNTFSQEVESLATLVENSKEASQFYIGLQNTELIKTLQSEGPYTVFAPSNNAFEKLDSATTAELLDPRNKKRFSSILKFHIIKGNYDLNDITQEINKGDGQFRIRTLNGDKLIFSIVEGNVNVSTEKGGRAIVNISGSNAKNGVVHSIDTLFMP